MGTETGLEWDQKRPSADTPITPHHLSARADPRRLLECTDWLAPSFILSATLAFRLVALGNKADMPATIPQRCFFSRQELFVKDTSDFDDLKDLV